MASLIIFQCWVIHQSSLEFEKQKHQYSSIQLSGKTQYQMTDRFDELEKIQLKDDPARGELYIRSLLVNKKLLTKQQILKARHLYKTLLSRRPSWPYYYSGLSLLGLVDKNLDIKSIEKSLEYGKHENKVVKSMAQLLFSQWEVIDDGLKKSLLEVLSEQNINILNSVVNVSSRLSRVYEFCDYLYEKYKIENRSCKSNYWQPLITNYKN